jgi:peptidoglycan/LPS O-acetylase OafA/YrhL
MLVAKKALDGFELKKWHAAILFTLGIAAMAVLIFLNGRLTSDRMWLLALLWYPFIIITPGLCLAISLLCRILEKIRPGKFAVKLLDRLGTKTFSVYLVHILVLDIFANMLVAKGICADTNWNRLFLVIPITLGCLLLELVNKGLQKLIYSRF